MNKWILALLALVLASCGGRMPVIQDPPDGTTYTLGKFAGFNVTLADNNYQDVTIEIHGWTDQLKGEVVCESAPGSYARCYPAYGQGGMPTAGGSSCMTAPCYIFIKVIDGSNVATSVVKFVRGTAR